MQEGFVNYNTGQNFDPNSLAKLTSRVIMFLVINDVSPSIESYADSMNTVSRDVFIKNLKESHRKDEIVIKTITFSEVVKHKSGFLPILSLDDDYLDVAPEGRGTALFDAVLQGLKHAIEYREQLEDQGIIVKTAIFISTDGIDNSSDRNSSKEIQEIIKILRNNEAWAGSFTINMLGVGEPHYFRDSCTSMGLDPDKCLVTVSNSSDEIRKQMGVVSASVSSSAATKTVNF